MWYSCSDDNLQRLRQIQRNDIITHHPCKMATTPHSITQLVVLRDTYMLSSFKLLATCTVQSIFAD